MAAQRRSYLSNPPWGGCQQLGVEVADSATVHAESAPRTGEGLFTDEEVGIICLATEASMVTGRQRECRRTTPAHRQRSPRTRRAHQTPVAPEGGVCCGHRTGLDASDDRAATTGTARS
jgi:lactoylglutathione lyase